MIENGQVGAAERVITPRNQMKRSDVFKLANWLHSNMDRVKELTCEQCVVAASHDIGITLTEANLRNIVVDMGIPTPWKKGYRPAKIMKKRNNISLAKAVISLHAVIEGLLARSSFGGLLHEAERTRLMEELKQVDIKVMREIISH